MPDPFRLMLVAPSACGKTFLMAKMLKTTFRGRFDRVYLMAPTKFQPTWKELGLNEKRMFDTCDDATFTHIFEEIKSEKEKAEKKNKEFEALIIMDDCLGSSITRLNSQLSANILKLRHYKASIMIATQLYRGLPRVVRVNVDKLIIFNVNNKKEISTLTEEQAGFEEHYYEAVKQKYGYLFIDLTKNILDPDRFLYTPI